MSQTFGKLLQPDESRAIEAELLRLSFHARLEPHKRDATMPEINAHHKVQRKILANNLFVQISKKYPHLNRSKRKDMANKIAYARVAEFLKLNREKKAELDKLRDQDYAEARPPEGWK